MGSLYTGTARRFEHCGKYNGADVYIDYAHHPTEISATLDMVKNLGYNRIISIFEPHTFTRTKALFNDFIRVFEKSDIISLHCPLTDDTYHIIDKTSIDKMKRGVLIVNTSRGALIDADALLDGIKSRKIGGACLDVYEEESDFFFEDYSSHIVEDDVLARLISMPNVLVTSHQAFLTEEALANIAQTSVENVLEFFETGKCKNEVVSHE